jgi:hypothetical protein
MGIYRLNTPVGSLPWRVDFGKIDFKTEQLKRLPNAYLGIESDDFVRMSVRSAGQGVFEYVARKHDNALQIQRFDFGRGLRASWFGLSLFGDCAFKLASMSFNVGATQRRI